MTRYSVQPRDIFVKGYEFLSFAKLWVEMLAKI